MCEIDATEKQINFRIELEINSPDSKIFQLARNGSQFQINGSFRSPLILS